MSKSWIAVACATHVRRGVEGGFMQVCHGKAAPLRRIAPGDPYRVDMGEVFVLTAVTCPGSPPIWRQSSL